MFLKSYHLNGASFVTDIVKKDYRTAEVFRKYGIEYCCGGKWPLEMVCAAKNIDINVLTAELEEATRNIQLPNSLPYHEWNIDFLADYIVNVHHHYLKNQLPEIKSTLLNFAEEHREKYLYLYELEKTFLQLFNEMIPHLQHEEQIIFPYIRQINHAFQSRESYASLLVKPNNRQAQNAPTGCHLPKIIAASAMKPRPAVILGTKAAFWANTR